MTRFRNYATLFLAALVFAQCARAADTANGSTSNVVRLEDSRIDDIDKNFTSVTVTDCNPKCEGPVRKISIDATLGTEAKKFHPGDHVTIDVDGDKLKSIAIRSVAVDAKRRFWVLGITAALCFFLTALITWWHPLKLIIGQDGRYSNSKFQMAIWFGVVIVTYIAAMYLRISHAGWDLAGVSIPKNLLLLSGMSALTFGGAKGITTEKVKAAKAANPTADPKPTGTASFWKNIIQNDVGAFDLGDFQMFVITIVAVSTYLTLTAHFLGSVEFWKTASLPDVDTTILGMFGLGQGAYLTKKAAGNVGSS